MTDVSTSHLHVTARRGSGQLWPTWQIGANGSADLVESVRSADDARSRVRRHGLAGLRIAADAWDQMVAAGAAPKDVPDDVTIV